MRPKKELGQNFLKDNSTIHKMILGLNLEANELVVEIGPGMGALTKRVSELAGKVFAVEFDKRLIDGLKKSFENTNVTVVDANILDWLPTFKLSDGYSEFKIIGSLPYYITSPILHTIAKLKQPPSVGVFLVQKEVAEKICEFPPDSSYLSSFVQTFYEVEYLGKVSKEFFAPVPKVDGGIIKLTKKIYEQISYDEMFKYEKFLHRCYLSPRKMLNKVFSKAELDMCRIDGNLRAQNLSSQDWLGVFKILSSSSSRLGSSSSLRSLSSSSD